MSEIKIEITKSERGFVPKIDDFSFDIVGQTIVDVKNAINDERYNLENAMIEQMLDVHTNHGLLYHMCGFDGKKQNEVEEYFENFYGVKVF